MTKKIKKIMKLPQWDKTKVNAPDASIASAFSSSQDASTTLTPNLRALRLAMTASDQLLSMGVPANNVVSKTLDITEAYCDRPVYINISSNLITLSQPRGVKDEPLTLIRPVAMRGINNMTVQAVQKLIYEIRTGKRKLPEAEEELERILTHPRKYPAWVTPIANASIAPAAVLMFTTRPRVVILSFVIALVVDRLLAFIAARQVAPFFRQVIAAAFITVMTAVIAWLAKENVSFFEGMDPTLIVVGGIMLLVSGLAFVGAIQDAIEEYYLTAAARLTHAVMLTSGIVVGILVGLYVARKIGIGIAVSPDPLQLTELNFQVAGAALLAGVYALSVHTRLIAVLWAGLLGGAGIMVMYASLRLDISIVPASGVAAFLVGLASTLFSRRLRTTSTSIISASILPLVPGLMLYTAIMQLTSYPPSHPLFFRGVGTVSAVIGTALAIAAGASFGSMLGRPLHQRITHARNTLPFTTFMRKQIRADRIATQLIRFRRPTAKKPAASKVPE